MIVAVSVLNQYPEIPSSLLIICLTVLSRQNLLVSPSLTCSFAANLSPFKIKIEISHNQLPAGSNPTRVRDFFSFSVWAHFLSRANAQKVLFGIFHGRE